MGGGMDMGGMGEDGQQAKSKTVQKHVVRASGMVKGGPEEYNANYYYIYCDLDTLCPLIDGHHHRIRNTDRRHEKRNGSNASQYRLNNGKLISTM